MLIKKNEVDCKFGRISEKISTKFFGAWSMKI